MPQSVAHLYRIRVLMTAIRTIDTEAADFCHSRRGDFCHSGGGGDPAATELHEAPKKKGNILTRRRRVRKNSPVANLYRRTAFLAIFAIFASFIISKLQKNRGKSGFDSRRLHQL
jgi:hypothetical protein